MRPTLLLLVLILAPVACLASSEVACDAGCPSGEKMISHADGDSISCRCEPAGSGMDETVPDLSVESPGESDT